MITGSAFVQQFASKGYLAWEAAAFALAENNELTPWPFVELQLQNGDDKAILRVQADVLSVGPTGDHLRLPLTPGRAQDIANLTGALLPTALLTYRIWQQALQLTPVDAGDMGESNKGLNLTQYAKHSAVIDKQLQQSSGNKSGLVAGIKKHVIVSNIYQVGKVLIFGWYRPHPPFPDVLDDGKPMVTPGRQPIQPKSNFHGDFYADYSHGIQLISGTCLVNGQETSTEDLYRHPTLSKLVSSEGPVRVPRYPSKVPVKGAASVASLFPTRGFNVEPTNPRPADIGVQAISEMTTRRFG